MKPASSHLRFRLLAGLVLFCVGLANADILLHRHAHVPAEASYGFYAWFGLFSCLACVLIAHIAGLLLRRKEAADD